MDENQLYLKFYLKGLQGHIHVHSQMGKRFIMATETIFVNQINMVIQKQILN